MSLLLSLSVTPSASSRFSIIVAANVIPVLPTAKAIVFILFLIFVILIAVVKVYSNVVVTDKLVNGLCGNPAGSNAIHSNWVACLRAENNGCPHNFLVLEQTGLCPNGEVCCFLQPEFFAEVKHAQ